MVKNICEMVYWSQIDTKYIRLCRILNCFYKKDRFLFYVDTKAFSGSEIFFDAMLPLLRYSAQILGWSFFDNW